MPLDATPGRVPLSVPTAPHVVFVRNFVGSAVCELRFPALVEIGRANLERFRKALRDPFPRYQRIKSVDISSSSGGAEDEYKFMTKGGDAQLMIRSSTLVLETRRYRSFEEFNRLLTAIVNNVADLIEASYFLRIGMRYINVVPIPDSDLRSLNGWINPAIAAPLTEGVYGSVSAYWQEVRGVTEHGTYSFRHGMGKAPGKPESGYILDFDFAAEAVEVPDALGSCAALHHEAYNLFRWALGPRAIEFLSQPATAMR